MKTWTEKNKQVVLAITYTVISFAVTVGFAGFSGFKSLNLVAIALFIGFISFGIFVTGLIGSRISEKPIWKNLRFGGLVFVGFVTLFVLTQMTGQIQ
ncbi:TPA: hypothetical protein DEP94_03870 [Candidatus Nomurabacteria bacterium]|nr:hypothetical protein [Candidatus Nomurabacteria bacterium]